MPHQCTSCNRTFPDGSQEMLSGCPDCGGNKFQFIPGQSRDDSATGDAQQTASSQNAAYVDRGTTEKAGYTDASTTESAGEPSTNAAGEPVDEDSAQAQARGSFVSRDELPDRSTDGADSEASFEDGPDIDEVREELNEQFESIKIVEPGEYELNLMELFDRQEHVIALEENGRYAIDMLETGTE